MCPDVVTRTLKSKSRPHETKGKTMIDWNSETWGNGVTYADNGSWVSDKHGEDDGQD